MVVKQICIYGLLAFCCASMSQGAEVYPAVSLLKETIEVPVVAEANVQVVIKSAKDIPLYNLQCHAASYTGDPDFDYTGDFECRLSSMQKKDTYSTLLTEDVNQSRDWESRGRFFAADLQGACALVPEFGAKRDFKLRGMKLTLMITDPSFEAGGKLKSLKLQVTAHPDSSALRPIADIVPVPKTGVSSQCKLGEYFIDSAEAEQAQ